MYTKLFGDTKDNFDRIGFGSMYLVIAKAVVYAGIFTVLLMLASLFLTMKATAEIEYKDAIGNIRYQNIRHN